MIPYSNSEAFVAVLGGNLEKIGVLINFVEINNH